MVNFGHEDEVNVTKPAQNVVKLFQTKGGYHTVGPLCDSVDPLSNITGSERVQGLLAKFAKTHTFGNLNFRMWSTLYIHEVDGDSAGNGTLLLEAFAAMLPWVTIFDHTNYAR